MSSVRDIAGKAGLVIAGGVFKIVLYVCIAVLIFWAGKTAYNFGYQIFNQEAMSPGEGQEITVVIKDGASVYDIGKTLKSKGLVRDAKIFYIQEKLSNYRGMLKSGTYLLSTAYTPERIMEILAGMDDTEEGVAAT